MHDPILSVACPTCHSAAGKPCTYENGRPLLDPHIARKTLASIELVKQKKAAQNTQSE